MRDEGRRSRALSSGGTSSETPAPKEVRHGCEHASHPANADASPPRAGCPWLGADRDDDGRRDGQGDRRHRRAGTASIKHRTSSPRWDCGYRCRSSGGARSDLIHGRADNRKPPATLLHRQLPLPKETWTGPDGRSSRCRTTGQFKNVQAHQIDGSLYQFDGPRDRPALSSSPTRAAQRRLPRPWERRPATTPIDFGTGESTSWATELRGPAPDVQPGSLPRGGTGSSHRSTRRRPDGAADRIDALANRLSTSTCRRATLHRCEESAAPVLQRLRRERRRTAEGNRQPRRGRHPEVHQRRRLGHRPPVRRARNAACREPPGFDFSSCDGANGRVLRDAVQHARATSNRRSAPRPRRSHDFIDYAVATYNVDPRRVYITGLSCGAFGVWEYLARTPADREGPRPPSRSPARAVPAPGRRPVAALDADADLGVPRRARRHGRSAGKHHDDDQSRAVRASTRTRRSSPSIPDRDHNSWDPSRTAEPTASHLRLDAELHKP